MFQQFLLGAQTELVLHLAQILDHEADGFALLHRDQRRGETHVVGHVYRNGAGDIGRLARLADGAFAMAARVGAGSHGRGHAQAGQ
ncbi:hypothetical protein D3C71_2061260 [compost metagenome]